MFRSFAVRLALSYALVIISGFCMMFFWVIRVELPDDKLIFTVIVFIIMAIESMFFTWVHYKMLISPLKKLNAITSKIAKGDYGSRIKTDSYDKHISATAGSVNKMASEFENLEEMRKSFVASASHEMRSPLTSMQGFLLGIIDGTIAEEEKLKYLNIVYSETRRLSALITSMLDLSRMESGKTTLTLARFDINELIRRVIIRFEPTLVKKEIKLDIDFVNETNYVFADKERIEQVIINLIDNAIKYSEAHTRILVVTHIHAKKIYVSVKDHGIGISKKDQLLIWDRFYMADKARTPTKSKGTGLGLSIVKKIVEDHNEIIWVESNKNSGSTFIFTLTLFDPNRHKVKQQPNSQPISRPLLKQTRPNLVLGPGQAQKPEQSKTIIKPPDKKG